MRIREILEIIGEEILSRLEQSVHPYIQLWNYSKRTLAVLNSRQLRLTLDLRLQDSNVRGSRSLWSFDLLQSIASRTSYVSLTKIYCENVHPWSTIIILEHKVEVIQQHVILIVQIDEIREKKCTLNTWNKWNKI